MISKEQFLPSITTISAKYGIFRGGNSWQEKIEEISLLGIKKVALFPTCLDKNQRKIFYKALEKSGLEEASFAHIRSDMPADELDYLAKRFNTKVFNTHSEKQFPLDYNLEKYKKQIFIENTVPWDEQEVKQFAGLCLDFSHLRDDELLHPKNYLNNMEILKKFIVGCNHISAISKNSLTKTEDGQTNLLHFDKHLFQDLSEFDYLKNYSKELFSNFCAIEVENSLADQLSAIEYICKFVNNS